MYSAEIAGDEEDEKEAAKECGHSTEEELSAKKAKRSKSSFSGFLHNSCCFHSCFCCSFMLLLAMHWQAFCEGLVLLK